MDEPMLICEIRQLALRDPHGDINQLISAKVDDSLARIQLPIPNSQLDLIKHGGVFR